MKKENESASVPSEMPHPGSATEITSAPPSPIYRAANGAIIDFHSPEFNTADDLNDCSGDYRYFEPLDGIVTSDMRHRMERMSENACVDASASGAPALRKKERRVKRDDPEAPEDTSPLTVISEGRTLIIDTDAARGLKCREVLRANLLACTLVVIKGAAQKTPRSLFNRLTLIEADDVAVSGAFCGFSATVTANGEQRPLTESFDLVLDLRPAPLFAGRRLPIGYYVSGANPEDLDRVLAEASEMRGRFKKPHFTAFVKSRCFHGRSRTIDCQRCVDVCPFGAIRAEGGRISINHYLCQGCSGCVLVCPADAIKQVHPSPEELLNILKIKLSNGGGDAALPATVVISDGGAVEGHTINFEVEEIGHVGLETILTAFSHGADNVVVACDSGNPQGVTDAVARQAEMARSIVKGLGMPEDKCRFIVTAEGSPPGQEASGVDSARVPMQCASPLVREPSVGHERRALIYLAAQHLSLTSGTGRTSLQLPAGSPFGSVTVDTGSCTLCMACVAACPSEALAAGGDVPRLLFVESRCHQCGLCRETCPERAVQLIPRMMCDAEQAETPEILCEAEVFRCIKCDAPFAPKKMVNRMAEKLKEHWMYANERQLLRLKMCRVCRTRDALSSEDMRLWNR